MPEIPKEEARKRLEDSVKNVDWITHFLGDKSRQESFLDVYRGLHSQLREGDSLEIEVWAHMRDGQYKEIPTATFKITLKRKDGKKDVIYTRDADGSGIGGGHLLYRD